MIGCGVVACVLAQLGYSEPMTLSCSAEPQNFSVIVELSKARLDGAPVEVGPSFELRDAGDAVFFVRDQVIDTREAFEWVSISRVSGRYAHFIAFRNSVTGSLESPVLITAAGCQPQTPTSSLPLAAISEVWREPKVSADVRSLRPREGTR